MDPSSNLKKSCQAMFVFPENILIKGTADKIETSKVGYLDTEKKQNYVHPYK